MPEKIERDVTANKNPPQSHSKNITFTDKSL